MLSVPRALTSKSVSGSTSDVVTATCPARWRTASWSRTCSASALAFLTSSLMKVTRLGYRVISHFRLRSVPGRLKLSSRVTCQPSLIRWAAALTPRKPAPPLMSTRRSGPSPSRSTLSLTYRALGSIAADTLAGRNASEEGDRYDPGRARQDEGLAPGVVAARVGVRAGDEQDLVGIVRNESEMREALEKIDGLKKRAERAAASGNREYNPGWHTALDLKNLLTVSEAIARAALERKESRGAQFRDDYPDKNEQFAKVNTMIAKAADGSMEVRLEPLPEMPDYLKRVIEENS